MEKINLKQLESRNAERRSNLVRKYSPNIIKEMEYGNQKLLDFFNELYSYINQISQQRSDEAMAKIQERAKEIGVTVKSKYEIEDNLQDMGVALSFPISYQLGLGYFKDRGRNNDSFDLYQKFNGHRLSPEMLNEFDSNEAKVKCENIRTRIETYNKEIAEIQSRIDKNNRKQRHTLLKRKKTQINEDIIEEQERLSFVTSYKRADEEDLHTLETIEKLTPEQKQEILKYINISNSLIASVKQIDVYKKGIIDIKLSRYNKELVTSSFEKLIEEKGLTEKDIIDIFDMLRKVESKTEQGAYGFKAKIKRNGDIEKYQNLVEAFGKYIYEPEKPLSAQEFLKSRFSKEDVKEDHE